MLHSIFADRPTSVRRLDFSWIYFIFSFQLDWHNGWREVSLLCGSLGSFYNILRTATECLNIIIFQ
jgi:hypothetical protein